jgi:hypothetical protein
MSILEIKPVRHSSNRAKAETSRNKYIAKGPEICLANLGKV